ncbi:MAG: RNA polymerase sigma factor [Clostridia bacterium]|nr:RNA polymerase sigma factor [Clostridia bacterium]
MPETTITQYAEPLFYFFLRKTGDTFTAEDLAADVLLSYLAALREERAIVQPHAWVWRVARNRYAAWARGRHLACQREAPGEEADSLTDDRDMVSEVIHRNDIAALRRELAFIHRDYRELMTAYYIEDRSVRDIARSLHLPEGTVKARLHRCRKMLKEGMQMARDFGPRSYNPETMSFVTSGNMPSDLPYSAISRRMSVNILLEASENPSTIADLSMALGVAAPYMEDEVELLLNATLLRRQGEKYVTDFFIMDGETASLLRRLLRQHAPERTPVVKEIALSLVELVRQLYPDHARMSDNDILWWLLPHVHETAIFADERYISDFPERACGKGETWGIEGFEQVQNPDWERCFMGRCINSQDGNAAGLYQYDHACEAMWSRAGYLSGRHAALLGSMIRRNRPVSSLTDTEQGAWNMLEGKHAHAENDRLVVDMIVLTAEGANRLHQAIRQHPRYAALEAVIRADYDRLLAILAARSPSSSREQLNHASSNEILNSRMMVISDCLADGTLTLPEHPETSTVGMWLEVN